VTIEQQLDRRRGELAAAVDCVVLVFAGDPVAVPGRGDRTYPFRSHSEYLYLTDRERPGGVLAYAPDDGWVDFVVPVSREERLWTRVDELPAGARPVDELESWLGGRTHAALGSAPATARTDDVREALLRIRRVKDDVELGRMRAAAASTHAGFEALAAALRPGATERALQIELESAFFRSGADFLAFDTIVAVGDHAAVLHFAPTNRALAEHDVVLVDAAPRSAGTQPTSPARSSRPASNARFTTSSSARSARRSTRSARASSGVTCTVPRRSRSGRASRTPASCVAGPSRWSRAAPSRSSSRTASGTWSGSGSVTRAASRATGALLRPASGSTCRSRPASR
jgi:hypothetical protein